MYEKWFGIYEEKSLLLLLIKYLVPIVSLFLFIISIGLYRHSVERQRAMRILQESETHYRNTFDRAPIGVVNVSLDGRFIAVNSTYCDIIGYSREELLTMTVMDVTQACDKTSHKALMQQLLAGEIKSINLEKQYVHKDRSLVWGSLSVQLSYRADGSPDYFIATIEDISKRKAIEQQLNILSVAIEQSPLSVVITDADIKLLYVNPRFVEVTGYSAEEALGKNPNILQSGLTIPDTYQQLWGTLNQGNIWHGELVNRRKNGEIYWEDAHITPVKNASGITTHYVGIKLDITDRKQMESAILESSNLLRTVIDNAPVRIFWKDNNLRYLGCNMIFAKDAGLSRPQDLIGKDDYQMGWAEQADIYRADDRAVMESGIAKLSYDEPQTTPNGETIWLSTSKVVLNNRDNEVIGVLGIYQDITQRKQLENKLRSNLLYTRSLIEVSLDPLVTISADGKITDVNKATEKVTGFAREHLIDSDFSDYFTNPDLARAGYLETFSKGHVSDYYLVIKHLDGHLTDVLYNAVVYKNEKGEIAGVFAAARDITERKQAETELRIAATVFESQEGMLITDNKGDILRVNKSFTQITGYSESEIIGKNPRLLRSGKHDTAFYSKLWQQIDDTGAWQGEIWNRRKNGDVYPEWLTITAVKANNDDVVTHYVATLTDITERKLTEERIHQLAFYDALTQLPNRRLLYERLKHGIELSRRTGDSMAVLMLDLDKFKAVNDSFGHAAGDELLQSVGERIKACLREMDTVARLGGDEFVVLVTDVNQYETAARIAKTIIETLTQPFTLIDNKMATIGASIGIAMYPQHGDSIDALMDNADAALYYAKDSGRGCFAYFSDDLTQKARERIALESRLRNAIERQELQVYFQAQIDVVSGQLMGAEALVRWNDGTNGLVMPSSFIALAEETGLIVPLGEFVLRETCRLGKQWLEQGLPAITLAVNVSPYQFRRCDISALVIEILEETGFPASLLKLEITESGLMENQQHAMTILDNLHKLGVRFAIDDFGTGYSSLSYLKFFPLDVLKIDKSFIDDIPLLASDMAITATIISIAHHLGFKVLAEGVETIEQLAFLQQQGCDLYQGYLHSKPLSADDFLEQILNG